MRRGKEIAKAESKRFTPQVNRGPQGEANNLNGNHRSRGSVPGFGLHLVRVQLAGSVSAKRRKEFQRDEEDLSFSREKDE